MKTIANRFTALTRQQRQLLQQRVKEKQNAGNGIPVLSRDSDSFRVSCAQQRLWYVQQLDPSATQYNLPAAASVHGPLDVTALEQTFTEIVCRHESLRTTFKAVHGEPVQVIAPPVPVKLRIVDLSRLSVDLRKAEAERLIQSDAQTPFDLAAGPLLRCTLLRLDAEEHILLMNLHHVIADSWSAGIMVREIVALYGTFAVKGNAEAAGLAPLPIQYADYSEWQRKWFETPSYAKHLSYWKDQLQGVPVLQPPADHQRRVLRSHPGAIENLTIPLDLVHELRAVAKTEGATPFMALLTAFQILLHRYTGQTDFAVGSPIAGRTRPETAALIGCFVNMLPLRANLSGDPVFAELLGRVRQVALDAYANQDVPFDKIVEAVESERDLHRTPLFQVLFGLREEPVQAQEMGNTRFHMLDTHTGTAKFELTMDIVEHGDEWTASLEYESDVFDRATIRRMLAHYVQLIRAIVADPRRRLSELVMLSEAERHQLLVEFNGAATEYPDRPAHRLFETCAEDNPNAIAVVHNNSHLSYSQLNDQANRLAHYLRSLGVCSEVLVAIALDRSVDMLVAILATLKAGAAYMPLDLSYPAERLAFMLDDSQAAVLICNSSTASMLPAHSGRTVNIETDAAQIGLQPQSNLPCDGGLENAAYVMYTSGSTGRPKGIVIRHRGIVRLISNTNYIRLKATDRMAQVSNMSFDAATFEIWGTLTAGACLVMFDREVSLTPRIFGARLREDGITTMFLTTALFNQIAAEVPDAFNGMTNLLVGGQAMDPKWVRAVLDHGGPGRLLNVYGPTESTTFATWHPIHAASVATPSVPIGRPVSNSQTYILDANLEPVPVGIVGELYIGGDGLARNYLRRPDLTADRFVPNPFSSDPGDRLYKTGDLTRYLPDGSIDFIGRADGQVKIRGFRVELGEIESVLKAHPAVRDAVVVVHEPHSGDIRIAAYAAVESAGTAVPNELRAFLDERLPEFMVPSAFVFLEALPLNANGKVDRAALPAPGLEHSQRGSAFRAPRSASEELLAGLFADLLGLDRVGIDDNFFDLGGHSLLATQLVSRIRSAFKVDLPVYAIFESPTIAGLAQRIAGSESSVETLPISPVDRTQPLPLSFAQKRLWFLDQLMPGSPLYHIPVAIAVHGAVDVTALERALSHLMARHESLRTRFVTSGADPVQIIDPPSQVHLSVHDLSSSANPHAEVEQFILDAARLPFDLASGVPVRFSLVRMSADHHVLVLTLHHIASDGWSISVLIDDLLDFYCAHIEQRPPSRPEPPIQYADFAVWQRQWLESHGQDQLQYWTSRLAGELPVLHLPADHPRPAKLSWRGDRIQRQLPDNVSQALAQLSRNNQVTLFMTLLAAWKLLLFRYSSQSDVLVGTPIANRTRPELESMIGFFVNMLVLRTDVSGDPTFVELLERVREVCLGAYAHQDLPFEQLVEALQPGRDTSHHPLFQVMFALNSESADPPVLPGANVSLLSAPAGIAKFDLTLEFLSKGDSLQADIEYSTELFERSTIERMMDHLFNLLESITTDPAQRLSELGMLSEAERNQLLVEFNRTAIDYRNEPMHRLIEEQVRRTPDAVAVAFEDATLSYADLDRRANQLAHYLRTLGVRTESLVGVCMERSIELVVALLGIVKAGAAYVPLDPEYPADRLEYMVQDAGLNVLLTLAATVNSVPQCEARLVCLDTDWPAIQSCSDSAPAVAVRPDSAVYMIYTSGSTGRPKGAINTHGGLTNRIIWMQNAYRLDSSDRVLQKTPFSFDVSVWEFFWPLMTGARLVMARPRGHRDSSYLARTIRDYGITTLHFVPSMLQVFLEEADVSSCTSLRRVISSGEALPAELQQKFFARIQADLHNLYGPTEAAIDVTHWTCRPELNARAVPIGHPIANTEILILDAQLQPVPAGVPGELYIGGDGLARGYYRRPDLTAERFVPHPFRTASRLYRTGDLACFRHDGAIDYLGRADHQVKIRGFRIEPGEIQARLMEHPAVSDALVLALQDRQSMTRLVAYLVAEASAVSTDQLRVHLGAHLPDYMIPSAFVFLDAFPLTPNGKLDRNALPAPEVNRRSEALTGPRDAVEEQLCRIWCDVLGIAAVGIDEDFFELGGHSLLATQAVSRIRAEFKVEIPLMALFEYPTVATIASVVRAQESTAQEPQTRRTITAAPRTRTTVVI